MCARRTAWSAWARWPRITTCWPRPSAGGALPLAQACIEVGAPQIRTRGTIAGNLITASPANDTIAPAHGARRRMVLTSAAGERVVPLDAVLPGRAPHGAGARRDCCARYASPHSGRTSAACGCKLGLRRAQAISVIHVAFVLTFDGERVQEARITLGCLAPTIVRARQAEAYLPASGSTPEVARKPGRLACADVRPIGDLRGSARVPPGDAGRAGRRGLAARIAAGTQAEGFPARPVLLDTGSAGARATAAFDGRDRNDDQRPALPPGHAAEQDAAQRAARGRRADRHQRRLRRGRVRRLHRLDRRPGGDVLPGARAAGPQRADHHHRGPGRRPTTTLHPLQQAFIDHAAVQCGFCIPGMIMAGAKLLDERPHPTLDEAQVGDQRQYLPLHRLPQDPGRDARRVLPRRSMRE